MIRFTFLTALTILIASNMIQSKFFSGFQSAIESRTTVDQIRN